ncbi:diaminopimelate decarboxylase [Anaerotignum faecicola]|nr:diaminopimelate decarboxylase [Anaerotignum faecicola]
MNDISVFIKNHEAPFYIYSKEQIKKNIEILKNALEGAEILFSIKANPFPPVIGFLAENGVGSDAASKNEVKLSLECGIKPENIYYSAAGKTCADIEKTAGNCTVTADSFSELSLINTYAAEKSIIMEVGLRVNPLFSMFSSSPCSSKFGVDEELLYNSEYIKSLKNIKITGIHVHVRSQVLNAETLVNYYNNVYDMALKLNMEPTFDIKFINFGGGIGHRYSKTSDAYLDFSTLKEGFGELCTRNKDALNARLIVESGRFLLCGAGIYVTEIVDIKTSRGKKYLIAKNGLNGFVRASMRDIFTEIPVSESFSSEPLYTSKDAFEISILTDEKELETVDLCGNLCTAIDTVAKGIKLPKAKIGDKITITNAGSYAYTLTPLLFSSHDLPKEYLI